MQPSQELAGIRSRIDQIDDQLVPLLSQRIALALQASRYKNTVEEVRGCDRVRQVLDAVASRAVGAGGDADTVVEIYRFIIEKLTTLQLREKGMASS
jgi:isochorismate pyruvate lyase